ncbi:MAG: sugar phosphate nucleotidyltransferase [Gemmatimonadota bacterium]|jgi:NDP-sugar pyrophosphorylase family protein
MEGLILAAGAGTRLGRLTDETPKALVEVGGKPLLGWVIDAMVEAGVTRIIINTHHHTEQIESFIERIEYPGIEFALSPEPDGPYETGGGLFWASHLFREEGPFLLHNADVLSRISLGRLFHGHLAARSVKGKKMISSLAVQRRESKRCLLFDEVGLLGWENRGSDRAPDGKTMVREPVGALTRRAFTGIHVVEPRIFGRSDRTGAFSIITLYLELAASGWIIHPLDVTEELWFDIGTPDRLEAARRQFL